MSAVCMSAVGCAGVEGVGSPADTTARITEEMNTVIAKVSDADLAKCTEVLQAADWMGARYRVTGPYTPSVRHSCVVQGWGDIVRMKPAGKRAAYSVKLVKVEGAYGSGAVAMDGYCSFVLEGDVLKFDRAGREMRIPKTIKC